MFVDPEGIQRVYVNDQGKAEIRLPAPSGGLIASIPEDAILGAVLGKQPDPQRR